MTLTVLNKIGTASILDNAITSGKIINNAVTASKIVSGAAGKILQVVSTTKSNAFSTTTTNGNAPFGVLVTDLNSSITPSATSSKILIMFSAFTSNSAASNYTFTYMYRNTSTEMFRNVSVNYGTFSAMGQNITNIYTDSPSSTSAVTYTVRLAAEGNTARIGAGASGGTANVPDSVITLMEIAG